MANLFNTNGIFTEKVNLTFSPELEQLLDDVDGWVYLEKFFKQIDKLPEEIAKIDYHGGKHYDVNNLQERIQVTRDLKQEEQADPEGSYRIHVAYQPGENYSMGNSVGKVFATNAGLILLNDVRLKQVADNPPNTIYLVNLIAHEILHIYGLDHSNTMIGIRNKPVMNLGKFGFVGMSHDDKMGLLEYYKVPNKKKVEITICAPGSNRVIIINREKKKFNQGKILVDGKAVFTHVKQGKYELYLNEQKVKNFNANKDKTIEV